MEHIKDENIWITRKIYEDAETKFYENLAKASVTPLAGEVAKARQLLIESRDSFIEDTADSIVDPEVTKFFERKIVELAKVVETFAQRINELESRLARLELAGGKIAVAPAPAGDSDVDLFGSDEEEDAAAAQVREARLAAYAAKKSAKPALVAKSNIILDIKPWDDETDMALLEGEVRKIVKDGLLWGASKLVPLAYGICKLQISSVVEDEKISVDELIEDLQAVEDYIQSVDIAAFNKI